MHSDTSITIFYYLIFLMREKSHFRTCTFNFTISNFALIVSTGTILFGEIKRLSRALFLIPVAKGKDLSDSSTAFFGNRGRIFTVHISRNSATTSRWLFRGESRVVERARANCTDSGRYTRACISRKINLPGSHPGCIYTWTVRSNRPDVGNLTLRTRKCLHLALANSWID